MVTRSGTTWAEIRCFLGIREEAPIAIRFPSKLGTTMSVSCEEDILPFAVYCSRNGPLTVEVYRVRRKKSAAHAGKASNPYIIKYLNSSDC